MESSQLIFRTLNESELPQWFDHCGFVFGVDRQYFVDHWTTDPWKDIKSIFVCIDESKNNLIASTVRVFHREVYFKGERIKMGGIGEVSTKVEYRSQGLARKLLEMANTYMLENNFVISLLSASRKNIPFYNKVGFVDIKENETQYTINNSVLENDKEESSIVLSSLSILSRSEEEQKKLRDMHANHSKKFNGSIYRNEEYWKNWITAWDNKKRGWALAIHNQSNNELIGYFSFSKKVCDTRGVIIRIEEFVLDESIELERRKKLIFESFRLLVKSWIPKNDDNTDNKEENHTICFRSSMVLSHSLLAGMEGTSQQCGYWGWMYQFLSERSKVNEEFESNFLFFGIDAF